MTSLRTPANGAKKLGIGIIGLGMASAPHAMSLVDLKERVDVLAAYSPTAARREKFAASYGLPVTDDLDAIFNDPAIGAVFILTPPNAHLELVRRAASAGKHILLEKPLDVTPERSRAILTAVKEADVALSIVFQNRFRPSALALRDLISDGRLGEIVSASLRVNNWRPQSYYDEPGRGTLTRDGGGVLITQGIHTIDLMISLAGLPEAVFASMKTSNIHRMESEDVAAAVLLFGNGAIGTLSATTCAHPGFPEYIELIGTAGTAILSGTTMKASLLNGTSIEAGAKEGATGTGADPMAFGHALHRALIEDFLAAIELGRTPRASGIDALKAHALIEALVRSSNTGELAKVEIGE